MTKLFLKILLNKKNDASFNYQYRQYYKTKRPGLSLHWRCPGRNIMYLMYEITSYEHL